MRDSMQPDLGEKEERRKKGVALFDTDYCVLLD